MEVVAVAKKVAKTRKSTKIIKKAFRLFTMKEICRNMYKRPKTTYLGFQSYAPCLVVQKQLNSHMLRRVWKS